MWVNTALLIKQPSDVKLQRYIYSAYYTGKVAKGAIFYSCVDGLGLKNLGLVQSVILNISNKVVFLNLE